MKSAKRLNALLLFWRLLLYRRWLYALDGLLIALFLFSRVVFGTITQAFFNLLSTQSHLSFGLLILPRMVALLSQAVNVLLEGVPAHLDIGEIEAAMCQVDGVRRVHDLHVWTLTSGREAMSAHVVVDDVGESDRLLRELHEVLHARFGIDHTTIQLETEPPAVLRIQGPSSV